MLSLLVELCRDLEGTRSRLEKLARTAAFLRGLTPDAVPWAVAFLTGRPFPAPDPRVLEVSWTTLAEVLDRLGPAPGPASLGLRDVAESFGRVAAARGPGSRQVRVGELRRLFGAATSQEREILTRVIHGEMRVGLHEGLLLEAVAQAAGVEPARVRRAALLVSDLAVVAQVALAEGAAGLDRIGIRLFVPLQPMLAEPAPDLATALAAHGRPTALEVKYDGARIQLHKRGAEVRIWSRRVAEVTASLPEVVTLGRAALAAESAIVEGEVVAVGAGGRPLPFQELMRRFRRVHAVEDAARAVPLVLHCFDCLLIDGRSLIDEPYAERWTTLERLTGGAHLARRALVTDVAEAEAFLAEALAAGHEGVIAKALDSPYAPGTRGRRWIKVKPAETVDCVIVAADRGSGRRRGWLSNYHLAVRDDSGDLAPVGKTFKGLTDREFAAMTERLRTLAVGDDGYTVTVRPEIVVAVAYNEIQRSPQYLSGFALRFARITRIRDDKAPEQATTLGELRALYERQFAVKARRDADP
jgi:DNA ligase-1